MLDACIPLFILKRRGASDEEQGGRKAQVKNAGMVLSHWLVVRVHEKLVTNALNIDRMHKKGSDFTHRSVSNQLLRY